MMKMSDVSETQSIETPSFALGLHATIEFMAGAAPAQGGIMYITD